MNIVKLKDIMLPDDCKFAKFFNENLKGKFAFWIQMRYIFPMNTMNLKTYIQYEQFDASDFLGDNILPHIDLYSEECCMFDFAQQYIDHAATERANAINEYHTANEYVADFDIDIEKLRNFRAWLAAEILSYSTGFDGNYLDNLNNNEIHMLEFYKNDMYNDVIKYLSIFGQENAFELISNNTNCGCCNTNVASLYGLTTGITCNALDVYIKNIHNLMVKTFEDVTFWMQFTKDFIAVFKKYIDNIIKTGLVINKDSGKLYAVCHCNNDSTQAYTVMLQNLSDALQYIIDDEIRGHSNFIYDALHNWAEYLYDNMSWKINQ